MNNAIMMAKQMLLPLVKQAAACIDATVGNGKDLYYLAANSPAEAIIWGFDIQEIAINKTKNIIKDSGLDAKTRLIQDSHTNVDKYVGEPVDVAMYNLGYLPGGKREIHTISQTTIASLVKTTKLLKYGGLISIVTYPGFAAGKKEQLEVHNYLKTLPQKSFNVAVWQMLNQVNDPPILYIIKKLE